VAPSAEAHLVDFMHGYALLGMGQIGEAIALCERSLARVPQHLWSFHVLAVLARAHAVRSDFEQAIGLAQRVRTLNPAFPEVILDLAASCALSGQVDRGRRALADLPADVPLPLLCASRPLRGQAWEGVLRDGFARLGHALDA
jgi:hypothetical protein